MEYVREVLSGERDEARIRLRIRSEPLGEIATDVRLSPRERGDEICGVVGIARDVTRRQDPDEPLP